MDCPQSLKRIIMQMSGDTLNYDDFEITKDGTHVIGDEMVSLETLKVKSGDKLKLKVNALAGAKRGRAAAKNDDDGDANFDDPDDALTKLERNLQRDLEYLQRQDQFFARTANTCVAIKDGNITFTEMLRDASADVINDVVDAAKHKMPSSVAFKLVQSRFTNEILQIKNVENNMAMVKKAMTSTLTISFMKECSARKGKGKIDWEATTELLTKVHHAKIATDAVAAAAADAAMGR
jgi:hypothetical protein